MTKSTTINVSSVAISAKVANGKETGVGKSTSQLV